MNKYLANFYSNTEEEFNEAKSILESAGLQIVEQSGGISGIMFIEVQNEENEE